MVPSYFVTRAMRGQPKLVETKWRNIIVYEFDFLFIAEMLSALSAVFLFVRTYFVLVWLFIIWLFIWF